MFDGFLRAKTHGDEAKKMPSGGDGRLRVFQQFFQMGQDDLQALSNLPERNRDAADEATKVARTAVARSLLDMSFR